MIPEIIKQWDKNKDKLENYFATTKQEEYSGSYLNILIKIIELVINEDCDTYEDYDLNEITLIDNGDYQGTQLFIFHKKTYQPSPSDYIYTHTYYGSCSGCDTLQAIAQYEDELPNEGQVKQYMALALHLIQKMKKISDEE